MRDLFLAVSRAAMIAFISVSTAGAAVNSLSPTSVRVFGLVPDARSGALGGAYTAVSDDAGCLNYNPAGLALLDHWELPAQKVTLFGKIDQYSLGLVYSLRDMHVDNLEDPGTLAFAYNTYSQDRFSGDQNGNFLSVPKAKGEVMTAAYGVTLLDDATAGAFRAGINAKFYKEEILNNELSWNAYDTGLLWNEAHCPLSLGASIQNINKDIHNPDRDSELPQTGRLGISYGLFDKKWILSSDYIKAINDDPRFALGTEFNLVGPLILRAGYKSNSANTNNLTGGIGVTLTNVDLYFLYARELCFNYAYTSFISEGDVQYFSIIIKLGAE